MSKIGMDPDQVRALSGQVEGQLGVLDNAQSAVALAGVASANPLDYLLSPGSMILSPWSITQAAIAGVEIGLARGSAQELIGKLLAEAGAQEWASSDLDYLYFNPVAWRTPDAGRIPQINPLDLFAPFAWVKTLVNYASDAWGAAGEYLEYVKSKAGPAWDAFKKWYDDFPPWGKGLVGFGKILPWVGTAITLADLGIAYSEGDVGGMVRNGVSLLADVVSFVPGPVGWVAAGVGILWDVGWTIGENVVDTVNDPTAMGEYYLENPWMIPVHAAIPLTVELWGPLAG